MSEEIMAGVNVWKYSKDSIPHNAPIIWPKH